MKRTMVVSVIETHITSISQTCVMTKSKIHIVLKTKSSNIKKRVVNYPSLIRIISTLELLLPTPSGPTDQVLLSSALLVVY